MDFGEPWVFAGMYVHVSVCVWEGLYMSVVNVCLHTSMCKCVCVSVCLGESCMLIYRMSVCVHVCVHL